MSLYVARRRSKELSETADNHFGGSIISEHMLPSFSIIIPTFNRPNQLKRCLKSLCALDYPRDRFEAIVVDDGSTLPLDETVESIGAAVKVRLIRVAHGGPAAARNAGALCAQHEYLAFTDDDCAPSPGWLQAFASAYSQKPDPDNDPDDYLLGGYTRNLLECNPYSTASQLLVDYLYEYYEDGNGKFFTSNNLTLSSRAFRKLDGFDELFPPAGEDRDLCRRAADLGMRLQFVPAAEVGHFHAMTLHKFRRQHLTYGKGAFRFHSKRRHGSLEKSELPSRLFLGMPKSEPLAFYVDLLIYPWRVRHLRKYSRRRAMRLTSLLFLSQIFNAAGYFSRALFRTR